MSERHDFIAEPLRSLVNSLIPPPEVREALERSAQKANRRRFTQEPLTGFGTWDDEPQRSEE